MSIISTVLGYVTRDSEVKEFGQSKILKFAIASNKKVKEGKQTTFVECSMWGSRGEKIKHLVLKGKKIQVSGEMSTREYNGKTYIELEVDRLEFADAPRGDSAQESSPPPRQSNANAFPDADYASKKDDDFPF